MPGEQVLVHVSLDSRLYETLSREAMRRGTSVAELVKHIIAEHVQNREYNRLLQLAEEIRDRCDEILSKLKHVARKPE